MERENNIIRPAAQPLDNDANIDLMTRLTVILERLVELQAPREVFKAPKYNGSGDIEYYIDQFLEVANANGWTDEAALIHLRGCLKGKARDCGRAVTLQAVFSSLRSHFGLSQREARAELATIKKTAKTTMQQHADKVSQLIEIGYRGLPGQQRVNLAVEIFANSLGNVQLQRHLLAVNPPDLSSAVRACKDYMNIEVLYTENVQQAGSESSHDAIQVLSTEGEKLRDLTKLVHELSKQIKRLQEANTTTPSQPLTESDSNFNTNNKQEKLEGMGESLSPGLATWGTIPGEQQEGDLGKTPGSSLAHHRAEKEHCGRKRGQPTAVKSGADCDKGKPVQTEMPNWVGVSARPATVRQDSDLGKQCLRNTKVDPAGRRQSQTTLRWW